MERITTGDMNCEKKQVRGESCNSERGIHYEIQYTLLPDEEEVEERLHYRMEYCVYIKIRVYSL